MTGSKALARRVETLVRSRRSRAHRHRMGRDGVVFEPNAQPLVDPQSGELINHHDVLLVPPDQEEVLQPGQFYRFPVTKVTQGDSVAGTYVDKPEVMDAYDYQERTVHSVASPERWGAKPDEGPRRGPAFATLPVKPEPAATSCGICYLINTNNLNFRNAWTAEEWNDTPGGPDLPPAPGVDATELEALLAGPRGKVFRVRFSGIDVWQPGDGARFEVQRSPREAPRLGAQKSAAAECEVECLDLGAQVEVWNQLRNGCVIGRVLYEDSEGERVVPLVNITSLTPDDRATHPDSQIVGLEPAPSTNKGEKHDLRL